MNAIKTARIEMRLLVLLLALLVYTSHGQIPVLDFPTRSPTVSPTSSPSNSPVISPPTVSPTDSPSVAPSTSPTALPTGSPTPPPTAFPTESPTLSPTNSPSTSPTSFPSESPTSSPTSSPSEFPTLSPTQSPSTSPTSSPSFTPTTSPTFSPSLSPTTSPTSTPTNSPTSSPTLSPTSSPTASPTSSPTTSPTTSPTLSPTSSPTSSPTVSPTLSPTSSPTASPTNSPTLSPTSSPTTSPTVSPTTSPTASPTLSPTLSPTVSPTMAPTVNATVTSISINTEKIGELDSWFVYSIGGGLSVLLASHGSKLNSGNTHSANVLSFIGLLCVGINFLDMFLNLEFLYRFAATGGDYGARVGIGWVITSCILFGSFWGVSVTRNKKRKFSQELWKSHSMFYAFVCLAAVFNLELLCAFPWVQSDDLIYAEGLPDSGLRSGITRTTIIQTLPMLLIKVVILRYGSGLESFIRISIGISLISVGAKILRSIVNLMQRLLYIDPADVPGEKDEESECHVKVSNEGDAEWEQGETGSVSVYEDIPPGFLADSYSTRISFVHEEA